MLWESDLPVEDVQRYSRQIIIPKIKVRGQKALDNAKVLIVGMGGLGSPVLMYLAATGIREIGIVDFDRVELHNLQRQVIHREKNIGEPKTRSAKEFAVQLNSSVRIVDYNVHCNEGNVLDIVRDYDVVADCCDDIQLRYILSDACRVMNKDLVSASVLRWEGQICVVPRSGACYRCMFPSMKTSASSCDSSGVMGPVCGIVGSMQANEIVKLIALDRSENSSCGGGAGSPHECIGKGVGQLILFNGLTNITKTLRKSYDFCNVCTTRKMGKTSSRSCPVQDSGMITELSWSHILGNLSKYKIVDIRSNDQFSMFRVAGSVNIPDVNRDLEVIRGFDKPVVVSCYRGVSSIGAARFLKDSGVEVYSSAGGIEGFKDFVGFKDL